MLSNEKELNDFYAILEDVVYKVKNDLLTKQDLNDEDLNSLYDKLKTLSNLLDREAYLPRKLTSLLFSFYVTAETEMSYREPKQEAERYFIPYLQTYVYEIFRVSKPLNN